MSKRTNTLQANCSARAVALRTHVLRLLLLATVSLAAVCLPTAAHAEGIVGPGVYEEPFWVSAQVTAKTTCVGNTNSVYTALQASPDTRTNGQYMYVEVFARDLTGGVGAWTLMRKVQQWVPFISSHMAASAPVNLPAVTFTGREGHYYQVAVRSFTHWSNSGWEDLGFRTSAHYTTFGAPSYSVQGNAIQAMSGASATYCQVR